MLNFLLSLVASLSDSVDLVAYKRASEIASEERLDDNFLYFFGYAVVLAVFPVFFFFMPETVKTDFPLLFTHWQNLALLVLLVVPSFTAGAFWSAAYANERISVLAPYSQLAEILTIVFGFFLFRGATTWAAFGWALVAAGVIFASNYQWGKRFVFNKFCLLLAVSESFRTVSNLVSAFVVEKVHPLSLVFAQCFVGFAILLGYFAARKWKGFRLPKRHRNPLVLGTVVSNLLWILVTGIGLYLYKEAGVVNAILLSMVALSVGLAASYFVYGDKPAKKDIATAAVVLLCIAAASI
jgi:drug/metabolite transporter (DMT)-like permease